MLSQIFFYLNNEVDIIAKSHQKFGYKERMQIERGLFLLTKILCNNKLRYNLQGFSKAHRDRILELIRSNKYDSAFIQLIDQVFQFKVFLQSLSSESAYTRGDALSSLDLNRQNVFTFINLEIKRICDKTTALNSEDSILNCPDCNG